MKTLKDWVILIVVVILSLGLYMLLKDTIDNTLLVLIILIMGFVIGRATVSNAKK